MSSELIHKPNFFILGAGKCGTTSLYAFLKQHPDIYLSPVKEPTFFCEDFQIVKNPVEYFELFDPAGTEAIIGEASHAYLTNPSTARIIRGLFPEAKFVVVLRNPADRAYSLYNFLRRYGYEWIGTFEKALKAEDDRYNSPRFRQHCPHYFYNFLYFRSGLYGEQLQRYFSLFNSNQFHILSFDDLFSDPVNSVRQIFRFLRVNEDFVPEFGVHNEGKMTARVALIQYIWHRVVVKPRIIRNAGLRVLYKANLEKVHPMRPDTRESLMRRYADDLKLLFELTGRRFFS